MDKKKNKSAIEEKWFIWIMADVFAIINIAGILILGLSFNWAWHFSYIALIAIDLLVVFGVCYYCLGKPDEKHEEHKEEIRRRRPERRRRRRTQERSAGRRSGPGRSR